MNTTTRRPQPELNLPSCPSCPSWFHASSFRPHFSSTPSPLLSDKHPMRHPCHRLYRPPPFHPRLAPRADAPASSRAEPRRRFPHPPRLRLRRNCARGNFESTPMFWSKVVGRGFPAYASGRFDHDTFRSANTSFRLDIDSGSAAYQFVAPAGQRIQIDPNADYHIIAFVKTTALHTPTPRSPPGSLTIKATCFHRRRRIPNPLPTLPTQPEATGTFCIYSSPARAPVRPKPRKRNRSCCKWHFFNRSNLRDGAGENHQPPWKIPTLSARPQRQRLV